MRNADGLETASAFFFEIGDGMEVKGKTVYLSGPMSGIELYNAPAFVEAHATLNRMGAAYVYDPVMQWLETRVEDHEDCMVLCLEKLTDCWATDDGVVRNVDLLVQLPGWDKSEGARLEAAVADACGIRRVELRELEKDTTC